MPSTLVGLLVAVYLLIPGYCYHAARRRTVPTRPVSTVIEGANLLVVAMVANTSMLVLYGALQGVPWIRGHSPSIVHLLRDAEGYLLQSNARLAWVGGWSVALLAGASALAVAFAHRLWPIEPFVKRFAPALSDESVWHRYFFIGAPKDSYVYLESHLNDGSYVAGPLVWYNTDLEDSSDRDLVIGQPLTLLGPDGEPIEGSPGAQAILSAREIRQILVTYVDRSTIDLEEGRSSGLAPGASEPLGTVSGGPRMSE